MRGLPCSITPNFADSQMGDMLPHNLPLGLAREVLGQDIRTHMVSPTMDKCDLLTSHGIMAEPDVNPVCSRSVSHRRALARCDHSNRGGVILHELDGQFLVT